MLIHTPIQQVCEDVWVKREDLSCPSPGPPFAKVRGLLSFLRKNQNRVIGYVETPISMAGWGVSYLSSCLGMKSVIYYPAYKGYHNNPVLEFHKEKWKEFEADVRPIQATRLKIMFYMALEKFKKEYGDDAVMLPLWLPLKETILEVAKEVVFNWPTETFKSVVICIGSGTMAAGVLRGLDMVGEKACVYGVAVRNYSDPQRKKQDIIERSNVVFGDSEFVFINTDYEYLQTEDKEVPFPCNPYYDAKAWRWLMENLDKIEKPVLFWNVGAHGGNK